MALKDSQKNIAKKYQKHEMTEFFTGFQGLNNPSYYFFRPIFKSPFFLSSNFLFWSKYTSRSRNMGK